MEIDKFAYSKLTTALALNWIIKKLKDMLDFQISPTGELRNYSIDVHKIAHRTIIDRTEVYTIVYKVMLFNFNISPMEMTELRDASDLYNTLNFDVKESYIILHNYCCKRLREEISKFHPELSLMRCGKKY